jgi:hypothetical protein
VRGDEKREKWNSKEWTIKEKRQKRKKKNSEKKRRKRVGEIKGKADGDEERKIREKKAEKTKWN